MISAAAGCIDEALHNILTTYYNNKVFSAATVAVGEDGETGDGEHLFCLGSFSPGTQKNLDDSAVYDLASLTKPLVTLPCLLHLIEAGRISWDDQLAALLDPASAGPLGSIDLESLVCHRSGLPAHEPYFHHLAEVPVEDKRRWLLERIISSPLNRDEAGDHRYSDLGYMLLGIIIERQSGMKLDECFFRWVAEPLGIEDQLFFPAGGHRPDPARYIETGTCSWSGVPLIGVVHDDNCRALGGVCGHAGLFGTAGGVLALAQAYLALSGGRRSALSCSPELFRYACRRVGDSEWTRGFNLVSGSDSSSGTLFSANTIGHLGFTGVSFWIDLDKRRVVVLLTNRVINPEDHQSIKAIRPAVHDAVMRCLDEGAV